VLSISHIGDDFDVLFHAQWQDAAHPINEDFEVQNWRLFMATSQSMQDKICLVTGATSGMGKETALGLARMGATVVLVARNKRKGEEARQEIARQSGSGPPAGRPERTSCERGHQ
jgi:hypothetical protein